ncbi:hypothetical protein HK096_006656, partial [Nowakowskiella sp. JEL0078]
MLLKKRQEVKKKIDAEWKIIKAEESQKAIDRARRMQYIQQPRVRRLHANLQTSQILFER